MKDTSRPYYANPQEGRMGFREPDDFPDDRPCIKRSQFWADHTERATYEYAIESNPRKEGQPLLEYLELIIKLATGKLTGRIKSMPAVSVEEYESRLPYRD